MRYRIDQDELWEFLARQARLVERLPVEATQAVADGYGGPNGHVALWLGKGMLVQCSASGNGSNIRPLAGYVAPTGWLRWNLG